MDSKVQSSKGIFKEKESFKVFLFSKYETAIKVGSELIWP